MKKFLILMTVLALAACTFETKPEGKPYDELPPLTKENVRAVFKAIPAAVVPEGMKTLAEREKYLADYDAWSAEMEGEFDYDADYNPDDPTLNSSFTWSQSLFSEEAMFDSEHGGVSSYATFDVYPGVDPDKFFVILHTGSFSGEGSQDDPARFFWYSLKSGKCREVSALPLDKPYTEADLTADPLITYGSESLYYAMKDKNWEELYMPKYIQVYINGVGMTDVVYNWNGVEFVRDEAYRSPIIYNFGMGNIPIGASVPYNIEGYTTEYVENPDGPIYNITRDGETKPTMAVYANIYNEMKIWRIDVFSDRYTNYHGVYPGMKANEVLDILNESNEKWYGGECAPSVTPEYGTDGKYSAIFSDFDDNFIYFVRAGQYLGGNRFKDDAVVECIAIAPSVG